jgi:hypothetical protein
VSPEQEEREIQESGLSREWWDREAGKWERLFAELFEDYPPVPGELSHKE